jgi:hypothetical protein
MIIKSSYLSKLEELEARQRQRDEESIIILRLVPSPGKTPDDYDFKCPPLKEQIEAQRAQGRKNFLCFVWEKAPPPLVKNVDQFKS